MSARSGTGDGQARTRRRGKETRLKGLNLAPSGKKSLAKFVEEKQPKTNHDRSAVCVYWLAEIAKITPVTVDHVYTCYLTMRWRLPKQFTNSLAVTANKKGYIDTSDGGDIKIVPAGLNHVNHDLPPKEKP